MFLAKITFAQNDIEIYKSNIRELLDFQQFEHDISGETTVKVKLSAKIKPKVARFNWTMGNYNIKLLYPRQESVLVQALKPGMSSVFYEAFDQNDKTLGKVEIPISVPVFIWVYEFEDYNLVGNAIPEGVNLKNAKKFNEVLSYGNLLNYRQEILTKTKSIVYELYKDCNVRFVWEAFGEKMPIFYQKKHEVRIHGFAREYFEKVDSTNASLGFAPNFNANVTMGRILDRNTVFAKQNDSPNLHAFKSIFDFFNDKSIPAARKSMVTTFWKEVFYKMFSFTIAHEVGHTLLPRTYVHTDVKKHGDDIMAVRFEDSDIGLIKKGKIDWRTFPLPGTYKWGKMKEFNDYNISLINLPTFNDSIFSKFYSISN